MSARDETTVSEAGDDDTAQGMSSSPFGDFEETSETFPRSATILINERSWRSVGRSALAAAAITGWLGWLYVARVPVLVESASARIEVVAAPHAIASSVKGLVVRESVVVGELVRQGDVLVELDSTAEKLAIAEEHERELGLGRQIEELKAKHDRLRLVAASERDGHLAARRESLALANAADTHARNAQSAAERLGRLNREGLVSESDLAQTIAMAQEATATADARLRGLERLAHEQHEAELMAQNQISEITDEIVHASAEARVSHARIDGLKNAVALRSVLAPVTGRVASVTDIRPGHAVEEGAIFGFVVPVGRVQMVARFTPNSAIGRIKVGQRAIIRFDAFPWTRYGLWSGRVTSVAAELVDGFVRGEVSVETSGREARLEHGLTGFVDVEVDRVYPITLLSTSMSQIASARDGDLR